jgi:hypothetical protein
MGDDVRAEDRRCFGDKYLRLADMENLRRTPTQPSMASRLLSTFESAGLAATATFASVVWIGLALPGLPLLPGLGGGQNSNVAISLNSAILGVQDSRTFTPSIGTAGRQARLLSLLLPAPDPLGKDLATKQPDTEAGSGAPMVVALPPAPPAQAAAHDDGPRVIESTHFASAASAPAPSPPAPPPAPPVSSPPPPRQPDPKPQTPAPPALPIDPPPPTDPDASPVAGDTPPSDGSSPDTTTPPDPGSAPGNGNGNGNGNAGGNKPNAGGANAGGNGNGNGNAGGNNPNAGGNNPNAGGANAGGNGNGNGNAGGNNPNAGGNNPNAGGANAGGNGNGNGAPKGPNKGQ